MEEVEQTSAETSTTEATQSDVADNQTETESEEPQGPVYDHVNPATDDPKLVQARIDTLYKERQIAKSQYKEMMDIAQQQSKVIEELQAGTYAIANHLQQEKFTETEASLKQQYRNAIEIGDVDAQISLNEKLLDMKVQKLNAPKLQPQKQQAQPQPQYNSAEEPDIDLDPQEAAITSAWQHEKDASGNPLRPWTVNSTGDSNDPDPDYVKAIAVAQRVFTQPQFANLSYQQKLQEIDKRMGIQQTPPQQNVMTPHLTGRNKSSKVNITDKQKEIAVRTKFGGPGAKSEAEHINAFRKQLEKVQSNKGAR